MKTPGFDIVTLKSGVKTMRDLSSREVFHTGVGPMAEALQLHAEQQRLAERCAKPGKFILWDVGLGGAANAVAALSVLKDCVADVEIHSFDIVRAPTEFALDEAEALGYVAPYAEALKELLTTGRAQVSPKITWVYHLGDFRKTMQDAPKADAVFYDPYSSTSNQELWTLDHLKAMLPLLNPKATITNYSASNAVRVTWMLAGYFVGLGVTVGQKSGTLYASPSLSEIKVPLDEAWLQKLLRSQSSAPILDKVHVPQTIQAEDFNNLSAHSQFDFEKSLGGF